MLRTGLVAAMIASTHAFMPAGLPSLRRTSPLAAARLPRVSPGLKLGRARRPADTTSLRMNLQVTRAVARSFPRPAHLLVVRPPAAHCPARCAAS